jgi:hypothetical protein
MARNPASDNRPKNFDADPDRVELKEEGQDSVLVGMVYREKNGKMEVIPFNVDFTTAMVQFAEVGKSREDRMRSSDFLNRFVLQGTPASVSEEDQS